MSVNCILLLISAPFSALYCIILHLLFALHPCFQGSARDGSRLHASLPPPVRNRIPNGTAFYYITFGTENATIYDYTLIFVAYPREVVLE